MLLERTAFWTEVDVQPSLYDSSTAAVLWCIEYSIWSCNSSFHCFFVSVIGVGIGASVFIYAVIRLRLFTVREWLMLPFGKKILRLNKKLKVRNKICD